MKLFVLLTAAIFAVSVAACSPARNFDSSQKQTDQKKRTADPSGQDLSGQSE